MKIWNVATVFGPDALHRRLVRIELNGQTVFAVTEAQLPRGPRYTVVFFEEEA